MTADQRRYMGSGVVINVAIIVLGLAGIAILLVTQGLGGEAETMRPLELKVELSAVTSGLESPVFLSGAGDGSGDRYIVEQRGQSGSWPWTGASSLRPSLTSATGSCTTTSAACSASRSIPSTARTAGSSCSIPAGRATAPPPSVSSRSGSTVPSRTASAHCWSSPRSAPCTRAACSPSTATGCCSRVSATAVPATTPRATGRTAPRCWPRCYGSMSTAASPMRSRPTTASPTIARREARSRGRPANPWRFSKWPWPCCRLGSVRSCSLSPIPYTLPASIP